jgi:hypothetical protein
MIFRTPPTVFPPLSSPPLPDIPLIVPLISTIPGTLIVFISSAVPPTIPPIKAGARQITKFELVIRFSELFFEISFNTFITLFSTVYSGFHFERSGMT